MTQRDKKSLMYIIGYAVAIIVVLVVVFTCQSCKPALPEYGVLHNEVFMSLHGDFYVATQIDGVLSLSWITPRRALEILAEDKAATQSLQDKFGTLSVHNTSMEEIQSEVYGAKDGRK